MDSWNFFSLRNVLLMIYEHDLFISERDKMIKRIGAAVFAASLLVGPAVAQSTTPSSEKQETPARFQTEVNLADRAEGLLLGWAVGILWGSWTARSNGLKPLA